MLTIPKRQSQTKGRNPVDTSENMKPEIVEYSGVALRTYRRLRRISQAELAAMIGVHENTVRAYEKGEQSPTAFTMAELAAILNVEWRIKARKKAP